MPSTPAPARGLDPIALAAALHPLARDIAAGRLITASALERGLERVFGRPASTGAWDWRTAYDVLEAASALALVASGDRDLAALIADEAHRPTQTRRSEAQIRLQQFSTPLPYASVAAEAAALNAGDLVLEPSAGCGALAACAKRAGATLLLNEIDPRRRALLGIVFGQSVSGHDGATLDDVLARHVLPAVVLMNPPFSSSFDRADDSTVAARHLTSALKRLAPGGRLVAIMPTGFGPERQPRHWAALTRSAQVHVAITVPGSVYRKNGTAVETQLIVADKGPEPGDGKCRFAHVSDLAGGEAEPLRIVRKVLAATLPPRLAITHITPPVPALRPAPRPTPAARRPVPQAARAAAPSVAPLDYAVRSHPRVNEALSEVYAAYRPQRIEIAGATAHPTPLVESVAMASVAPPAPTARPNVPSRLVETGALSEAQLETVIYARDAHERRLAGRWTVSDDGREVEAAAEDDADAATFRAGFFLGDGTGCGKGRQVAAILLDNWIAGRRRALWVSKSDKLFEDALRDWSDIGGSPSELRPLSRWKPGARIIAATGVLFTTYATLRAVAQDGSSRLDQVVAWLTEDRPAEADAACEAESTWGPLIAFDEAHAMGNAAGGEETGRGARAASLQGLAGLRLQNVIPEARVLYVSATGATTVENLAYATRLGLWGADPTYPFPSREAFLAAMHLGGVAAMEVVARDLKAMGLYLARSLSFEGVEYEMTVHTLTGRQRAIYDEWARAFQIIHRNLGCALRATNIVDVEGATNDGAKKSAVMSRFESLKQRFFNHMLTGMKTPAMCEAIRGDLDAGHSVVVQLVSTGEALLSRRIDGLNEADRADLALDLTPREYVLEYLAEGFPVTLQRVVEDNNGNLSTETVTDPETGAPVISREAAALRDALIEKLALLDSVPTALDQIVWSFGTEAVAEVTGRSQRPVWTQSGSRRLMIERRGASASVAETRAFMEGTKRILVFSEAGGTGRSYHAALTAKNRQRRIHYLLEPGWKADSAVQGLGRSHRAAQASAPLFRVMSTDVQGEKRFVSTIARRLDTLGALTKGQRQTGSQGLFRAEDSLESPIARASLRQLYRRIAAGQAESVTLAAFEELTGLTLMTGDGQLREDLPPMARFLNRMLALEINRQNAILEELATIIAERTEIARQLGTLELGVETIRAGRIEVIERKGIHTDARTGAVTELVTLQRTDPVTVLSAAEAMEKHAAAEARCLHRETAEPVFVHRAASEIADDGTTIRRVRLFAPTWDRYACEHAFRTELWDAADDAAFRTTWANAAATAPRERVTRFWMVTGLLLPIWKHLPQAEQRIWRAMTDDGVAVLGRVLSEPDAGALRALLAPSEVVDAASVLTALREEDRRIALIGGAALKIRRIGNGPRLEIEAVPVDELARLKAAGCFTEIITWRTRVFLPYDPHEPALSLPVLDKVLAILPIAPDPARMAA